jgi:hypothetical protein
MEYLSFLSDFNQNPNVPKNCGKTQHCLMKMCSVIFEFLRADLQMDVGRTYITKPTDAVLKIFIANATRLVRIYMSHFKTVLKRLKRKLQTNAVQGVVIYFSKLSNYRIEVLFLFVPHSKYGGSCSTLHVASEVS